MSQNTGGLPRLHLFVVEDHADTLKYLSMFLKSAGHRVSSASSMTEALDAFPESEADVLISDIGLPDGDGWELLRRLSLARPIHALAMSGLVLPKTRREAGKRAFAGIL